MTAPHPRPLVAALAMVASCAIAAPLRAEAPQELEQLEPGAGQTQFEYQGLFGPGEGRSQALGWQFGASDRLVVGFEIEGEKDASRWNLDEIEVSALYRVARFGAGGIGLKLSGAVDRSGRMSGGEARLVADYADESWGLQANLLVRREIEQGPNLTRFAAVANIGRAIADEAWLGIELSGDFSRTADPGPNRPSAFAGPAASIERELPGGTELELGVVGAARLAGDGPKAALRLFGQITF